MCVLQAEGEADEGFVFFVDDADEGGAEGGEVGAELEKRGRWRERGEREESEVGKGKGQ